jgi:hypothetical protein
VEIADQRTPGGGSTASPSSRQPYWVRDGAFATASAVIESHAQNWVLSTRTVMVRVVASGGRLLAQSAVAQNDDQKARFNTMGKQLYAENH